VYAELVLIKGPEDSGEAGNPVTLMADNGAILDGTNITPFDSRGLLTIEDASFIVVDGLEIRNFKTPVGASHDGMPIGITVRGAGEDIELRNNKIHNIEERSTCTQNDNNCSSGANGIGIYGSTPAGLKNIRLIGNEVFNNILGSSESVTLNGNIDGFLVADNFVHDNNNIGFDFIGGEDDICAGCSVAQNRARNGIVSGNRAFNNSIIHFGANPWYAGDDGNAAGFYVDGGRNILIEQNISMGNDLGMEVASEAPGGSSDDILIASNLIYNNFDIGIALGGFAQSTNQEGGGSINRVSVINNTFYHNSGHSSELTFNFRIHDLDFINNIIFGETSIGENYEQASDNNLQSSGLNFDNNIWWASQTRDAVPVNDARARISDPDFVDIESGNARTQMGSNAVGVGVRLVGITTWNDPFWTAQFNGGAIPIHGRADVYGAARQTDAIDIGAAEQ
jgi:hypothetical protein